MIGETIQSGPLKVLTSQHAIREAVIRLGSGPVGGRQVGREHWVARLFDVNGLPAWRTTCRYDGPLEVAAFSRIARRDSHHGAEHA